MPTVETFHLPDLGEGLEEADLLVWLVQVGDTVTLNQNIAEVETAKASVELPSPFAGTVVKLHATEGTTVDVGSAFIDIEVDGDSGAGTTAPAVEDAPAIEAPAPMLVGYGVAAETVSRRSGRPNTHTPAAVAPAPAARPMATPPVRFAAKQQGIDLASITPTGERGQITRDDVANAQRLPEASATHKASAAHTDEVRTPIKGVRKITADAMVRSAFTAPHVTEFVTVDVTPMMDLLAKLKQSKHFADIRVGPLALVAKALLVALRANPSLNSSWDEDNQEIVTKHVVNLGIAAATPRGLMVPNIKDAHLLSLQDLARELSSLTVTAKEGKTGPEDLASGTITITNVGVFGIDAGTPILNPGEAAILCFGSIRKQPWVHDDEIAIRSVTTLSLSFDHRLVDGEQGSRFLAAIAEMLSDPTALLALS